MCFTSSRAAADIRKLPCQLRLYFLNLNQDLTFLFLFKIHLWQFSTIIRIGFFHYRILNLGSKASILKQSIPKKILLIYNFLNSFYQQNSHLFPGPHNFP
ncbi:hypothetical protein RIR_jg33818.t1 [Rhizophagus irregularis DAOM 181602=DAOM 197198]|nr:hypothetical protein RIR_jg33818.t1 [Rhizophagus irregularis DAOM 181602=DAOM 197198]